MTAAGQARASALAAGRKANPVESYETLTAYDRCISRSLPGAMLPGFYNHNYQIVQTRDYVVILVEMIHDARIVPLDNRPHASAAIRSWLGDSRGRWEDDTLVVETKGFSPKSSFQGSSSGLRLVERFTRVADDVLQYDATMNDPTTWTRPWTARILFKLTNDPLLEYACHEGNVGMVGILSGARKQEAEQASGR